MIETGEILLNKESIEKTGSNRRIPSNLIEYYSFLHFFVVRCQLLNKDYRLISDFLSTPVWQPLQKFCHACEVPHPTL
jgi:hypothetical protein